MGNALLYNKVTDLRTASTALILLTRPRRHPRPLSSSYRRRLKKL